MMPNVLAPHPPRSPWARLEDFSLYDCELGEVDFRNAEFVGEADFALAHFKGRCQFDGAIFRVPATFSAAKFKEHTDFDKTEFCTRAEFENAKFEQSGDFYDSTFRAEFVAMRIRAETELNFKGSEFFGTLYMRKARFGSAAVLDNCVFHDFVQLVGTKAEMIRMDWATWATSPGIDS
jgi:hypothetical protein